MPFSGRGNSKKNRRRLRLEIERAQRAGDYAKASELQYGRGPELDQQNQERRRRSSPSFSRASGC